MKSRLYIARDDYFSGPPSIIWYLTYMKTCECIVTVTASVRPNCKKCTWSTDNVYVTKTIRWCLQEMVVSLCSAHRHTHTFVAAPLLSTCVDGCRGDFPTYLCDAITSSSSFTTTCMLIQGSLYTSIQASLADQPSRGVTQITRGEHYRAGGVTVRVLCGRRCFAKTVSNPTFQLQLLMFIQTQDTSHLCERHTRHKLMITSPYWLCMQISFIQSVNWTS